MRRAFFIALLLLAILVVLILALSALRIPLRGAKIRKEILSRTYTRKLKSKLQFRFWAAFRPSLAPRPLQTGRARKMV